MEEYFEYVFIYKKENLWKEIIYVAKSDEEALGIAKVKMKSLNVKKYFVDKIVRKRIF